MEGQEAVGQLVETGAKRKEFSFPEEPKERLSKLLASFNASPKAVVMLLLPDHGYISSHDLIERFREMMAGTSMARTGRDTALAYCEYTLCPIGLVAKEYSINSFGEEVVVGFGRTVAGEDYGLQAACLLLDFENTYGFSLYPIIGRTHSSGRRRSPDNRVGILSFLAQSDRPVREMDLVKKLGVERGSFITSHLEALRESGVIDYEALNQHRTGKIQITYQRGALPLEKVKVYRSEVSLTREVVSICQELREQGREISQTTVLQEVSEDRKQRRKERTLSSMVSGILSDLVHQGYLERSIFKGGEKQSDVKITEKGRVIVLDFIVPLEKLVTDDLLEKKRIKGEVVSRVLTNLPQFARRSAEMYYPFSLGSKVREAFANGLLIKEWVLAHPFSSSRDIAEALGLNLVTVRANLRTFLKAGEVDKERKKFVDRYCIRPKNGS